MTATPTELETLSEKLWQKGIAAFCPTTLSVAPKPLLETVSRLGAWIRRTKTAGAIPLGLHLEGPFIHPEACGAHPSEIIRPLTLKELNTLWEASFHSLKIVTFAPELLTSTALKALVSWANTRKITLSLGHSRATTAQAQQAFDLGVRGLTHAWNALPFHHRSPGPLGAALGRPDVSVEMILDQIHVDPVLIQWTQKLHPSQRLCFVSDCAPAAETRNRWLPFGPLQVIHRQGACRLKDGSLAGGGILLSEAFGNWVQSESSRQKLPLEEVFRKNIAGITQAPLSALGLSLSEVSGLKHRKVQWVLTSKSGLRAHPNQNKTGF